MELQLDSLPATEARSDDALQVLLLANLQEQQDSEMNKVLEGLPDKVSVQSLLENSPGPSDLQLKHVTGL